LNLLNPFNLLNPLTPLNPLNAFLNRRSFLNPAAECDKQHGIFRAPRMLKLLLALLVAVLYVLHQDVWLWDDARPLVCGFLPIGLFYHAIYTIAVSGVMWLMVRYAWPAHLEREVEARDRSVVSDRSREPSPPERGEGRVRG